MSIFADFRRAVGWTQARLAAELGIHKNSLGRIETGRERCGLGVAEAFCDVAARHGVQITLDQVFGRSPAPAMTVQPLNEGTHHA